MPTKSPIWTLRLLLLAMAGLCGMLVFLVASRQPPVATTPAQGAKISPAHAVARTTPAPKVPVARQPLVDQAGAKSNELLVRFRNASELAAFLDRVRKLGGRVLATIPRFGAARIAFDSAAQEEAIRAALPKDASAGLNYLVSAPTPPNPQTDTGGPYLGFGNLALSWLGVPADNANWGNGIKIAVLDTGIYEVAGLSLDSIRQIDLVGTTPASGELQDHGTLVASIIGGDATEARGVAPGADLLGIRVLDDSGSGDSFTVAQGILSAVDNGARVISLSIGSQGDSAILLEAINYALARNVAVVAAVGNDGRGSVSYPAQYPGVIAVTAVDANGQRGGFANYGAGVTLAAPGIGVETPWVDDQHVNFSGTSAAVPFVSGTLAMLFSENPNLTATEAVRLLVQYSNDAGAPGTDPMYGAGILSVDRLLNRDQPGINDAAVADLYYNPAASSAGGVPVLVTVQNRGTTLLSSLTLEVQNGGKSQQFFMGGLAAGRVQSQTILLDPALLVSEDGVTLHSRVMVNGVQDTNTFNDSRTMTLRLATPAP